MAIKRKPKRRAIKKRPVKKIAKKKVIKKKPIKRKPAKKLRKPVKAKVIKKIKKEDVIGIVTHYFPKVKAAVVKLKMALAVGDAIKIKGHTTDFKQNVTSMQIDRVPVQGAKKGEEIGVQVNSRVRQHDVVYKAK